MCQWHFIELQYNVLKLTRVNVILTKLKNVKNCLQETQNIYRIFYVLFFFFSFRVVFNFKRHLLFLKVYKVEQNFCIAGFFCILQMYNVLTLKYSLSKIYYCCGFICFVAIIIEEFSHYPWRLKIDNIYNSW